MLAVLDTNVLVSAFWSPKGEPARILALVQNRLVTLCYDYGIIAEYRDVLLRPKFGFSEWEVIAVLAQIENEGISVVPCPLPDISFTDEDDRKFYEVARHCRAKLITGNGKHFPKDDTVLTVKEFLTSFSG
jgi:putative PIN family toxin of toxin-antitoxin system